MSSAETVGRAGRSSSTREAIADAAERLFAERGVDNVSHRQISAAAGQGNVAAVGYHFGTTDDLLRAIVDHHVLATEKIRHRLLAAVEAEANASAAGVDARRWLQCLILPAAQHLENLGSLTWWARLSAQLATDPRRQALLDGVCTSPTLQRAMDGFWSCLPRLPVDVRSERRRMARILKVHVFAGREAQLASAPDSVRGSWIECAEGVTDALLGLWWAPVSRSTADVDRGAQE